MHALQNNFLDTCSEEDYKLHLVCYSL